MEYSIDVITADASKLKNRGLAFAFTSSPYIITAFAGPKVADEFYYQVSWRWGLGCWAIIFPIVAAPLYFILKSTLRKAEKQGHRIRKPSGRSLFQNVCHWTMEFDCQYPCSFYSLLQRAHSQSLTYQDTLSTNLDEQTLI
jgi:MFS family permease